MNERCLHSVLQNESTESFEETTCAFVLEHRRVTVSGRVVIGDERKDGSAPVDIVNQGASSLEEEPVNW